MLVLLFDFFISAKNSARLYPSARSSFLRLLQMSTSSLWPQGYTIQQVLFQRKMRIFLFDYYWPRKNASGRSDMSHECDAITAGETLVKSILPSRYYSFLRGDAAKEKIITWPIFWQLLANSINRCCGYRREERQFWNLSEDKQHFQNKLLKPNQEMTMKMTRSNRKLWALVSKIAQLKFWISINLNVLVLLKWARYLKNCDWQSTSRTLFFHTTAVDDIRKIDLYYIIL